jgi:hypothetical protein
MVVPPLVFRSFHFVIPRCAIAHRGCAFGRQLPT